MLTRSSFHEATSTKLEPEFHTATMSLREQVHARNESGPHVLGWLQANLMRDAAEVRARGVETRSASLTEQVAQLRHLVDSQVMNVGSPGDCAALCRVFLRNRVL